MNPDIEYSSAPDTGSRLIKNAVAVMNIEMKALFMMEGKSLAAQLPLK
jgi:hypothetical protein